jgi:hypothetical protein
LHQEEEEESVKKEMNKISSLSQKQKKVRKKFRKPKNEAFLKMNSYSEFQGFRS